MLVIHIEHAGVRPCTLEDAIHNKWQGYESRNDWDNFDDVVNRATQLTTTTDELYIPIDCGDHTSPRFDIIKAPKIGDDVSYAFNGDCYPCGQITKISKSLRRIETTETTNRKVFWRHELSGSWINNKTWSLVLGHIWEQNPSF